MTHQNLELHSLRDLVTNLTSHLSLVAEELAALKTKSEVSLHGSYALALTSVSMPVNTNLGNVREKSKPGTSSSPIFALAPTQDPRDRKFNLLVFGLKESIKGTPKHTRDQKDHSDVCDILSLVEPSVTSNSAMSPSFEEKTPPKISLQ